MKTHFYHVLPLLQKMDDETVENWGKSFEWTTPELHVVKYSDPSQSGRARFRRSSSLIQPAIVLLTQGDARLKRLLFRSDMFGDDEIFCDDTRSSSYSSNRPLDSTRDLWNDIWSMAWGMGDVDVIDRIRPWIPDTILPPSFNGRPHFLQDWGRCGHPDQVPDLLLRFSKIIEQVPEYIFSVWGVKGRDKARRHAALNHWMTLACGEAAMVGNFDWIKAVSQYVPGVLSTPSIAAATLNTSSPLKPEVFSYARQFLDNLPEKAKPNLKSDIPDGGIRRHHSRQSWLELLTRSWERVSWRGNPSFAPTDIVENARWLCTCMAQASTPDQDILNEVYKESISHVSQWGTEWLDFLSEMNIKPTTPEVLAFLKEHPSDQVLEQRLSVFTDWNEVLKGCDKSKPTVTLFSRWAGRFSGQAFPEKQAESFLRPSLLSLAHAAWTEGQLEALNLGVPLTKKPSKAHRI